jgi:hypothetical protein
VDTREGALLETDAIGAVVKQVMAEVAAAAD